jgi:hypothetical protein
MTAMLCVAGCAPPAQRPPRRELPRLGELQTGEAPPLPNEVSRGPAVRLRITRLDLPFDAPLDETMSRLEQQGIAPPIAPRWLDNGMFVRIVTKATLDGILHTLPPPSSAYRTYMTASNIPTPLDYDLVIRRRQRCVVAMPDGTFEQFTLTGGRVRFLIEAVPQDDRTVLVSMTPQHHEQKISITPRSVLEKQLDGRIFEALRLQVRLKADEFFVALPLIEKPQPAPTSQPMTNDDEQQSESAEQPSESSPPPDAPDAPDPLIPPDFTPIAQPSRPAGDLGRLLLQASRHEQPLQLFVIIGVDQLDQ